MIKFDETYYKDPPLDSLPDRFFKVFRKEEIIQSTEDTVLRNEKAGDTEVVIEVAHSPEEEPKPTKLVKSLEIKQVVQI